MKILHYSLGFPPYRSGGMTTYCMSLIEEQNRQGHDVSMMWAGAYSLVSSKTRIVETDHYVNDIKLKSFEIKNGLPVPLLDGIRETKEFQKPINKDVFDRLFMTEKFEILHVHTLMGLPVECIASANEHGVKTVFTSHDNFGICCKQGLFVNQHICKEQDCLFCYECNRSALSLTKISILQSSLYRCLKDSFFVKVLRKRHNNQIFSNEDGNELIEDKDHAAEYILLRKYYINLLNNFQLIQYNSSLMKQIYESFGVRADSKIYPVSHKNINTHFIRKEMSHQPINIGYFGPINIHKGFFFLKGVLDEVYKSNKNFKLHVYKEFENDIPYIVNHKPYNYGQLHGIMEELDLVCVPSQGYESFGFNTLEALSFAVPVIVTENVGAKDLIIQGKNGYVENSKVDWVARVHSLLNNSEEIIGLNRWILENQRINAFDKYVDELVELLYCK